MEKRRPCTPRGPCPPAPAASPLAPPLSGSLILLPLLSRPRSQAHRLCPARTQLPSGARQKPPPDPRRKFLAWPSASGQFVGSPPRGAGGGRRSRPLLGLPERDLWMRHRSRGEGGWRRGPMQGGGQSGAAVRPELEVLGWGLLGEQCSEHAALPQTGWRRLRPFPAPRLPGGCREKPPFCPVLASRTRRAVGATTRLPRRRQQPNPETIGPSATGERRAVGG